MSLIIAAKPSSGSRTIPDFFQKQGLDKEEVILLQGKEIDTLFVTHSLSQIETPIARICNCAQQRIGVYLQAEPLDEQTHDLCHQRLTMWIGTKRVMQRITLPPYEEGTLFDVSIRKMKKVDQQGRHFRCHIGRKEAPANPQRDFIHWLDSQSPKNLFYRAHRFLKAETKHLASALSSKRDAREEKEPLPRIPRTPRTPPPPDPEVASILQDFAELCEHMDWQAGRPTIMDALGTGKNPVASYSNQTFSKLGVLVDPQSEELQLWVRVSEQSFECHLIPEIEPDEQVRFLFQKNENKEENILRPMVIRYRIEERNDPLSYTEYESEPRTLYTCVTDPNH